MEQEKRTLKLSAKRNLQIITDNNVLRILLMYLQAEFNNDN